MFPEYGITRSHSFAPSIVQQTVPRIDPNAAMLQELLAAQKREFDEFKQTVLASLPNRANRAIPQTIILLLLALILDTPLTKDELTRAVNKHIDLENLQRKEGPQGDLRKRLNRRDPQGPSKKTQGGIGEISGNQKKARICYQTWVPPLGKEPEKAKKHGRENHPEVMSIQCEERYEEDNSPKERETLKRPVPHEEGIQ
ncbi:hypothetical protein LIER_11716 [Lithospermum erythrorhizon]|uniref:Uncharacterized protein n=1 Tax=Lithospermum erythrorhizon TaxID=34254 RepID=A0AAV3PQY3_LITER